jgi:hypothetical protein
MTVNSEREKGNPGEVGWRENWIHTCLGQIGTRLYQSSYSSASLESNVPDSLPRNEEAFASNHPLRDILVVTEITI